MVILIWQFGKLHYCRQIKMMLIIISYVAMFVQCGMACHIDIIFSDEYTIYIWGSLAWPTVALNRLRFAHSI